MTKLLSILIPSKNEPYLQRTIDDIIEHAEGAIQIISREDDGVGQRALTNQLAHAAKGDYIMKLDAHCSMSQGFDVKMIEDMEDDMIMSPYLLNLDEHNWAVEQYPMSSAYGFDTNLVFQYNLEAEDKTKLINETMCLQGSCWMVKAENYWDWNLCDEELGSWGHQGVELGIKAFLNGGRCVTNKNAYYGHLFRHSEADFPYKRDKEAIKITSNKFREKFLNQDIAPLIKKYGYPHDWSEEKVKELGKSVV